MSSKVLPNRAKWLILLLSAGCGGTEVPLWGTDRAASISGVVQMASHSGGNSMVEIDVRGLPEPSTVEPDASVFVVWFVSEDGQQIQKAGRLGFDPLSRHGRLRATTLLPRLALLVTAENSFDVEDPSGAILIRRGVPDDVVVPAQYRQPVTEAE